MAAEVVSSGKESGGGTAASSEKEPTEVTGGGGDAGPKAPGAIRIVSFNLNEKMRDPVRAAEIVAILAATRADVICLQEISDPQEVGPLARQLGMFYRRAALRSGMTILTRRPIARVRRCNIPGSYFNALVAVECDGVWYASIHLNSERYKRNEAERVRETEWILNHFSPKRGVMAGDWNSVSHLDAKHSSKESNSKAQAEKERATKSLPSELLEKHGWADTHAGEMVESTWIPATKKVERIDRVYCRGGWGVAKLAILGFRDFPGILKHGWPTGRDHKLVLADLYSSATAYAEH